MLLLSSLPHRGARQLLAVQVAQRSSGSFGENVLFLAWATQPRGQRRHSCMTIGGTTVNRTTCTIMQNTRVPAYDRTKCSAAPHYMFTIAFSPYSPFTHLQKSEAKKIDIWNARLLATLQKENLSRTRVMCYLCYVMCAPCETNAFQNGSARVRHFFFK